MLRVENLTKEFVGHNGDLVKAIDNVSFTIEQGKIFTLLGPSGCGKTTTLRSIAGLENPDGGIIAIGGETVFNASAKTIVPSNQRDIGMVFQSYAIWPHMTVFENVAYPLRVSKTKKYSRAEIKERVQLALERVQLKGYDGRPATQLSGGQQQRLALARALLREPKLILLDEPLSNLDAKLREDMRFELKRLQRSLGVTMIYVTHDQMEALALSNEIAVMKDGKIIQQGSPKAIYNQPNSRFVADFIGTTNFLEGIAGTASAPGQAARIDTQFGTLQCASSERLTQGQRVIVSMRPEDFRLTKEPGYSFINNEDMNQLTGKVVNRVFLGEVIDYIIAAGDQEFRIKTHQDQDFHTNETVTLFIAAKRCIAIPVDETAVKSAALEQVP